MTRRHRRGPRAAGADEARTDGYERALDRAFSLLAIRGRTTAELGDRLQRAGFAPEDIARVTARLTELNYLDDGAFARSWVAERSMGSRAIGRRRLAWDLAQKGVPKTTIESALDSLTPEAEQAAAVRLAEQQVMRKAAWPRDRVRSSIYDALMRRGFAHDAIEQAMARVGELLAGSQPTE